MRLIDADALMQAMCHRAFETDGDTMWQSGCWVRYRAVEQVVEDAPTIEPERKTGVWLDDDEDGKVMTSGYCPYCSVCKEMAECITKYCPHCGARMEGVE